MRTINHPDEVDAGFNGSLAQKPAYHEISITTKLGETANSATILTDPTGLVLSWSKAARDIFGYEEDEAVGHSLAHFFETKAVYRNELSIALQIAGINPGFYAENWLINKEGKRFWAGVQASALFDRNGGLFGYSTTIRDLTEIKKTGYNSRQRTVTAQKQPSAQINRYGITDASFRKLIENSYGGIILIDKSLNITFRSHAAERITGWNLQNWGSNTMMENIHLADREKVWMVFSELAKRPGNSRECIFRSQHADGRYIWLECVFTNFFTDPDIEAMVCNFRDITGKQDADVLTHQSLKDLSDYKCALDESAIVSITDQKGIIKYVNDSFCKISKYSREELIGQDHRIINSSFHDKAYIRNLWTTIAAGKIWKGELRNKAKDGSFYWVYATIVPFLNKRGKPYQYVSVRFDITLRKKIITELEESKNKYSELFHLSPLPMWVVNLDTLQFLDVNTATVAHYGHTREQFLSMTLKDIWPDGEGNKLVAYIKEDKQRMGEILQKKAVHKKKNGELINVEVQISRIQFNGIQANLVIATDVTEGLKYIKAVEEQNKKLREISWIQSHKVRAPLARIMGLIPLLKDAKANKSERGKIIDFLNSSAVELDEIIKDITAMTVVGDGSRVS